MLWDFDQQYRIVQLDKRIDRVQNGQADNRMSAKPTRCPKCEAMMSPKFGRCLFCGYRDESIASFT